MSVVTAHPHSPQLAFNGHLPGLRSICLTLAFIGLAGVALGTWGVVMTANLALIGSIDVQGPGTSTFHWLAACGSLLTALSVLGLREKRAVR